MTDFSLALRRFGVAGLLAVLASGVFAQARTDWPVYNGGLEAVPDRLRAMGWAPKIGLRDGIASTYRWFLQHAV